MSLPVFAARRLPRLAKQQRRLRQSIALAACFLTAACAGEPNLGEPGFVAGFAGAAVADEPHAALAGRDILSQGGTAGDAAAAMFFTLTMTKPAAAGLMASGVCLGYDPAGDYHQAYRFQTPAAVRAFAAIQARFGSLPWRQSVSSAEAMARFGGRLSKSFVEDWPARPALNDAAYAIYGKRPKVGDEIRNLDLAGLLGQIRLNGAGSFYTGLAAKQVWEAMEAAGIAIDRERWRQALPQFADSIRVEFGNHHAAFAPFQDTTGPAEAAIWPALEDDGMDALPGLLRSNGLSGKASAVEETAFAAADRFGGGVACTITMGAPFGTGRAIAGTFHANPATPSGSQILISNKPTKVFFTAIASSGIPGWASAAALATLDDDLRLAEALAIPRAIPAAGGGVLGERGAAPQGSVNSVESLGRVSAIVCHRGLPNVPQSCETVTDPRGKGYGAIAD